MQNPGLLAAVQVSQNLLRNGKLVFGYVNHDNKFALLLYRMVYLDLLVNKVDIFKGTYFCTLVLLFIFGKFVHVLIHSFLHSWVQFFIHAFIHSFICRFIHSLIIKHILFLLCQNVWSHNVFVFFVINKCAFVNSPKRIFPILIIVYIIIFVSLPKCVKRRIKALKKLQAECCKLEGKFYEEVHELECKYAEKFKPLYDKVWWH